ncbi:MAG: DNA-processing protein DprA [Nitriliruptorales bacterium]|nr:DNA-processing protein DprA [Nitriliruptorales bacterium]
MSEALWASVAAPGTDPDRLRRAVRDAPDRGLAGSVDEDAAAWQEHGVCVTLRGDPAYPADLAAKDPAGAPAFLAVRGQLPRGPAVAIVGARRASGYGVAVAAWLADAAARAGVTVISGGAVGIDAAAHQAAGRHTVAVLGCGHAVGYPHPHARRGGLFDQLAEAGGAVVSGYLPCTPPRPHVVRARNRLVAGLADALVVVEGGARSGSLVTAGHAADLGVPVLAVPGDVRQPGSAAPHLLLAEGAAPCREPADLLAAVGASSVGAAPSSPSALPPPIREHLAASWPRPIRLDELARRSGMSTGQLLAAITAARVDREVVEGHDGVRLRAAPG